MFQSFYLFDFILFRRHAFYPIKTMVLAHSTLSESLNSILKISTNSICPMKFGIIFASNFHQFSCLFRHRFSHRFVHPFLIKKQWFGHPFWHMLIAFGNIFRCFFGIYFCINFLMPFFRTFGSLWATLGRLFGFLIENGHQNGTHFAPGDHLLHSRGHPGLLQKRIRSPTSILDGFLMDLGWILDGFWMDLGWILHGFWMDLGWISTKLWTDFGCILEAFYILRFIPVGSPSSPSPLTLQQISCPSRPFLFYFGVGGMRRSLKLIRKVMAPTPGK